MSHARSPEPCKSCHWALEGLKRPPNPAPEAMAEIDAFFGDPASHRGLIKDRRGRLARAWMDKIHPALSPPITKVSCTFWEDYGEQTARLLPHKTHKQQDFFGELMLEFYPDGPRYL